jgi:8-oxo-dGTP diphosphatase
LFIFGEQMKKHYICKQLKLMNMEKKESRVVAAVIKDGDKYLCMQRCRSRIPYITERWEFPGGKVEQGESFHQALIREIKEEMDWDIFVGKKLGSISHEYPDFKVKLTAFLCKGGDGEFKMLEHLDYKWLTREEMDSLNWTEADRKLLDLI